MRRRSSKCESSYCAPPLCYLPCLPKKSKDDAAVRDPVEPVPPSHPAPAAAAVVVEDKPPVVQKMEQSPSAPAPAPTPSPAPTPAPTHAAAAAVVADEGCSGVDGDGDGDGKFYREREVAVAPKSCLKRADCEEDSGRSKSAAAKGNVKWRDLLGKDLTQVKEFEPSESGDSDDEDYGGTCACVIQ